MQEIKETLEQHGVTAQFKGKGLLICCPYHDDSNPSMQVFENGFKCYACGEHGNLQKLFVELGIEQAPKPDLLKSIQRDLMRVISTNLHCMVGIPDSTPFKSDYRGITKKTFKEVRAFYNDDNEVSFPLYDLDFNYRGYIKKVYGEKYINNFTSGWVPFNMQNLNSNSPIIVEGVFDALSVIQLGYKNCIACLGTGQVWNIWKLLKRIHAVDVKILFDNDDSGQYAAKKLNDLYRNSTIITIPEANKDPNNYKLLRELLECSDI